MKRILWVMAVALVTLLAFLNPYLAIIAAVVCVWFLKD